MLNYKSAKAIFSFNSQTKSDLD